MSTGKQTRLHGWHEDHGANMALFGNYHMPLWYATGAKTEHLAVIRSVGIFDTSHMAAVAIKGVGAWDLLQRCLSKDLDRCVGARHDPLVEGRCVYGVFLHENGEVLDDAIAYQLKGDHFLVIVNAGMGEPVSRHLAAAGSDLKVTVEDLTDRVGKMDIQGPASGTLVARLIKEPRAVLAGLPYFSFKGGFDEQRSTSEVELLDGTPLLLSRTGYTGEFGFELFVNIEQLVPLWEKVLEAGADLGVVACGLAARDSLRAGAVLPLSHQDIGHWPFANNPWQFALPLDDKGGFTKDFIGHDALKKAEAQPCTLPFAGFDPRKIPAEEKNFVTTEDGERCGIILTSTTDMAIGRRDGEIVGVAEEPDFAAKGLSCGFVKVDREFAPGSIVLLSDGKRKIKVEIRKDVRPGRTARKSMQSMLRR